MSTFDEVMRCEDALAVAIEKYADFKKSDEGYAFSSAPSDVDRRFVDAKRTLHVDEFRFKRDQMLRDDIERAENNLAAAQRQWLRRVLP